jgi:hypothetical protein
MPSGPIFRRVARVGSVRVAASVVASVVRVNEDQTVVRIAVTAAAGVRSVHVMTTVQHRLKHAASAADFIRWQLENVL